MAPPAREKPQVSKMAKLPPNAKVSKRPLMRPPIVSPYAGKSAEKVVYVSHRMPFMAGIHRVQALHKQIDKRAVQSLLDTRRPPGPKTADPVDEPGEPVIIKATGKAIAKALQMAHFFQTQPRFRISITTSSTNAIDDLERVETPPGNQPGAAAAEVGHDDAEDLPEARIRALSVVEIRVWQK